MKYELRLKSLIFFCGGRGPSRGHSQNLCIDQIVIHSYPTQPKSKIKASQQKANILNVRNLLIFSTLLFTLCFSIYLCM